MNESRIYDLNEEIRKNDVITTQNNEHLTILRERNEELRRSNQLMQQRNAKSTNGTGSHAAIDEHAGNENNAAPAEETPDQGLPTPQPTSQPMSPPYIKKQKTCRFYANGRCRFGSKCRFNHQTSENEGPTVNQKEPKQSSNKICRFYKANKCDRGE